MLNMESWIIVEANPLRWKMSESLYFHRRVFLLIGELLVFIGVNQQFTRVSVQMA